MEDILNIALCEDTREEEEKMLAILAQAEIPNRCTVFHRAEELLDIYVPQKFDLLLMDIFMDGMTGVEAVGRIREIDEEVPVAFITTSKDFALESYRLSAIKYIEKPYGKKAVEDALRLARMEKWNAPSLEVYGNGQYIRVPLSQIVYVESQSRQLEIYLSTGETVQIYEKLKDVLPQLEQYHFFQPHKSYCVNLAQVQYIDKELNCFMMSNGNNVPIRRESMAKAKTTLETFLYNRTRRIST